MRKTIIVGDNDPAKDRQWLRELLDTRGTVRRYHPEIRESEQNNLRSWARWCLDEIRLRHKENLQLTDDGNPNQGD